MTLEEQIKKLEDKVLFLEEFINLQMKLNEKISEIFEDLSSHIKLIK